MQKVFALGFDAAEWWLVEQWMADGTLPNLARFAEGAARARLENLFEFRAEAVWTQVLTGRSADESGYFSNVGFDPDTYATADIGASGLRPFWADLDRGTALVFDHPHSSVDRSVDAVTVTAWGAHSPLFPRASNPAGLLTDIDARFGPHPGLMQDNPPCWFDADYMASLTDALVAGATRRMDVLAWLLERYPERSLVMTVSGEPHSMGHHGWHGVDPAHPLASEPEAIVARTQMRRVYQAVDAAAGRFVELAGPDAAVVLYAAHGMQVNANDLPGLALLPELLYRKATGKALLGAFPGRSWDSQGYPNRRPRFDWGADVVSMWADSPVRKARRALWPFVPKPLISAAWSLKGGARIKDLRFGEVPISPERVDVTPRPDPEDIGYLPPAWYAPFWRDMDAFALPTFSDGMVRLNVEGREAAGRIPLDGYHTAAHDLAEWLRQCRDVRTGRPAVARISFVRAEDPLAKDGPPADLVVNWVDGVDAVEHPEVGRVGPVPFMRTGEHSPNGFAFVRAPGVAPQDLGLRSALDLSPTMMHLLGRPQPAGMAGSPLVRVPPG